MAWADVLNSKDRVKKVEVSEHVLKTYHESFLYGKIASSVKVRGALRAGWLGLFWYFLEFVLAIASGVLYVYSTYKDYTKFNWASRAQNYISLLFAVDYLLRVYSESARVYYIFSFWGMIDLISAIPIIFFARSANQNGQFLKLLQFLRIIRIISLINKLGAVGSTVLQQILLLVSSTFGFVFLVAGILQYVEYHAAPHSRRAECPEEGCINFWDAVYFTIVTISTVGYGDITPKTKLGRVVVMFTIIAALTVIPVQIGKITFLASRRPYGGSFNEKKIIDSRYLIISGSISFQAVQEYLAEFYNPTHCQDLEVYPLRVTILAPFRPSFELKQLMSLYNGLVEFIEGSSLRQADLSRVSAMRASAFFLLADRYAEDRSVEDAAQMVKALAVHRFCDNSPIRIIVEVLEPETEASAVWDLTENRGIEVICPIKYHFHMMARSCVVKGLSTFITNLFTSEIQIKSLPKGSFVSEYFHSFDNEVYPLILPQACRGMLFEEVVEFVFENYNVVLFALDVDVLDPDKQQRVRKVFLHPKGHVIDGDDVGLVICWDLGRAYAISRFKDAELETQRWRWKKRLSAVTLGKYRTGPVVDAVVENHHDAAPHISYKETADTIESRMKSEISNRGWRGRSTRDDALDQSGHGRRFGASSSEDGADAGAGAGAGGGGRGGDVSLESATEMLLAWPPASSGGSHLQPHASVLERRQELILQHLRERTVHVVSLLAPHILVCCQSRWPGNIFYFVKELRKPNLPNPPIVILHPGEPSAAQWGKVGQFEDVFFLKGSPIYELDLMRGGVLQAERVVILGFHDAEVDLSGSAAGDKSRAHQSVPSAQRSDVDNIVISANVERLVGVRPGVMIVDMQHTFALHYMRPRFEIHKEHVMKTDYRRNPDALVHFGAPYMEGKAVSLALLGYLLRASFYNKNTVSIVQQLIDGGHTIRDGALCHKNPRVLHQIKVATEYVNKQYGDLFIYLLRDRGMLALGLYRAEGTLGSPTAYVFTNPMKNTVVHEADLVYVIS